jgi:hypothetical protein
MLINLIHFLLDFEDGSIGRMLLTELLIALMIFLFVYALQTLAGRTKRRFSIPHRLMEKSAHCGSTVEYLEALYALPDLRPDGSR